MDEQVGTSESSRGQLPSIDSLDVPRECRHHPLVCRQFFYTLPSHVLNAVVGEIGEDRFDPELLTVERTLSAICGDHTQSVGFQDCVPVSYAELRPKVVPPASAEMAKKIGLNPAEVERSLQVYRDRDVTPLDRFSRGYCGWLLTNQQFLDEHDEVLSAHAATFRGWSTEPVKDPNDDPAWKSFAEQLQSFQRRWRLESLAGPYLPAPCKPRMGGLVLDADIQGLMSTGGVFYLPETMPIPSRDQLRWMLDDALHRGERPEHLKEWLKIVRAGNPARNEMDRFARLFELQHYWRQIHRRHESAIYRKTGRLEEVFASVFGVALSCLKKDLILIRSRLGRDWLHRPWPL